MKKTRLLIASVLLAFASAAIAQEIGYVEDFALAKDRAAALKQLIPGTEEDYYYRSLHYQATGDLDKVDALLKPWIERHGRSARVEEIEHRQALLAYDKNPKRALDYIRSQLGLTFAHQKEVLPGEAKLPTGLDPKSITRDTLTPIAMGKYGNLQGFEASALDWLADDAKKLDDVRRRSLLARLTRPDVANLVRMVADDLEVKNSGGFGALGIHSRMLQSQLDELLKLQPDLVNNTNFVNANLARLQPGPESNWRGDPKEHEAYLARLWDYVSTLGPVHNSLKGHVLHNRLVLDRSQGTYDKARFVSYLKLPRSAVYVNPKWLERAENRDHLFSFGAQFSTALPIVPGDDALVRDYLMQFLKDAKDSKEFADYIESEYLKGALAEAKIVNGVGDADQWYSLMPPEAHQALRDRVDLDFAFTNKAHFAPDDAVSLDVFVKNVPTLIVKVYEINALNYYRDKLAPVQTDISLDGLVANNETTVTYKDPPLRRHLERFEFPRLSKRGVYVVEFIGGGMSSRALVCKGRLHYIVRTGSAGHVFTVLDEANKPVTTATLYLAGHEFTPDKDGQIVVPFSTASGGTTKIVLTCEGFAWLDEFAQQSERYDFRAAFYVDRESLLADRKASVLIRPTLLAAGVPVSLTLLENVRLTITSSTFDGIPSSKDVPDFKLAEDGQTTFEFQVPDRLASLTFSLTAKVQNLSKGAKQDVSAGATFTLNSVETTDKIEDLFLVRADGKYYIDVLGRTGETLARRPVNVSLKHRDFIEPVHAALQTDENGRVTLGELADIVRIDASTATGVSHAWQPARDAVDYPGNLHGQAGKSVTVPYIGKETKPARGELSLLELRGGSYLADRFDALSIKAGLIVISDLPAGDYLLTIKNRAAINVRLAGGEAKVGMVVGRMRDLEVVNPAPLAIASLEADKDSVTVKLTNATAAARVHVFATRYHPEYSVFDKLSQISPPEPGYRTLGELDSVYVAGRNIGDEYRYILDRKYATKFAGNMLTRPGLLLAPWAIRKTEAGKEELATDSQFERASGGRRGGSYGGAAPAKPQAQATGFSNYDFLATPAVVLANLKPDDKGVVKIARKDLGWRQQVHVVAVDPNNTAYREISLPEGKPEILDLRLAKGLDPKSHFVEHKQITVLAAGDKFSLDRTSATSTVEIYDSLPRAYGLYATLSGDPTLAQFAFLLDWPKMKAEEKRAKYSEFACHELNFFLSRKDPEFFESVIQPFLKNKKDKTFMDHLLVGDDLGAYRQAWNFQQLNTVERILLAQRLANEGAPTARHVKDLYDLVPPNLELFNRLFQTALLGSALDTGKQGWKDGKDASRAVMLERGRISAPGAFEIPAPHANVSDAPPPAVTTPARPMAPAADDAAGAMPANRPMDPAKTVAEAPAARAEPAAIEET
ncbi:MAG: hypothetical protein PHU85_00900, partial [Phycisphaerae bacterium]|nr:hypothetical protein [Phycisphaerae bacterium]